MQERGYGRTLDHHSYSIHRAERRSMYMHMYLERLRGGCCRSLLERAVEGDMTVSKEVGGMRGRLHTLSLVGFQPFLPSNFHHSPKVFFLASKRCLAVGS